MEISAVNSSNTSGNNFVISQQIEKELTSLKQAINRSSNSSKYMALVNDIERLYAQGNVFAAKRKLTEVENMAQKEGIIDSNTPGGSQQNTLQNTVTPNIPQPIGPTIGISGQDTLSNETQKTSNTLQNTITPKIPQPIIPTANIPGQQTSDDNTQKTPYGDEDILTRGKTRTYQDASGDIGASFKHPTPLNDMQAKIEVPAHESGHVMRAVGNALVHKRKINYAYYMANWQVDYTSNKFFIAGGVAKIQTDGPAFNLKDFALDLVA
ncbi:MAG: hypothetical protein WC614_00215 [bacterium]